MCLAVPAEIVDIQEGMATCKVGESDTFIQASLMIIDEEPVIGDYVLIHAGFALRKLDLQEARETLDILREMAQLNENSM
jgi:hydrogenase expression/formation protein HypC